MKTLLDSNLGSIYALLQKKSGVVGGVVAGAGYSQPKNFGVRFEAFFESFEASLGRVGP